jgi:CRISPR-associated protein Csx10
MSDRLKFTVILEMRSDWCVGSGAGRQGSIDRLIERDADELPCVPAKTLRGMWRDAAEQLAFGLDEGDEDRGWTKLLPHLFGSQPAIQEPGGARGEPIPGRLAVSDAQFGVAARVFLSHPTSQPLRDVLTFIKPGVAIDPRSGQARADFLRFEEMSRKGIVLAAPCEIMLAGDLVIDKALAALAFAALKLLDRLGGKRRRGSGLCVASVVVDQPRQGLPTSVKSAIAMLDPSAPSLEHSPLAMNRL